MAASGRWGSPAKVTWGGNKEERPCSDLGLLGKWVYLTGVRRNLRRFSWSLLGSNLSGSRALKILPGRSAQGHCTNKKHAGLSICTCELFLLHSLALWLTWGLQLCCKALFPSQVPSKGKGNLGSPPAGEGVLGPALQPDTRSSQSQRVPEPAPRSISPWWQLFVPLAGWFWEESQGNMSNSSAGCRRCASCCFGGTRTLCRHAGCRNCDQTMLLCTSTSHQSVSKAHLQKTACSEHLSGERGRQFNR